jgi:SAM-dependent methyltransferase
MRALYDAYFASRDYDQRYPEPNRGTLDFLRRHGAMHGADVLDVGCGNGRYAIPWLQEAPGRLTGCDISAAALQSFARKVQGSVLADRVRLVHGGVETLNPETPFNAVLLMFGVLSHVHPRQERQALLRRLRELGTADCRLFLSVPSIWRRRPLELLASLRGRNREAFGDIHFSRWIAGQMQTFYYHLYSLRGLRTELASAGWTMVAAEAESVLPEWWITRSARLGQLDHRLQPWCPAALGYGIRALAQPAGADP